MDKEAARAKLATLKQMIEDWINNTNGTKTGIEDIFPDNLSTFVTANIAKVSGGLDERWVTKLTDLEALVDIYEGLNSPTKALVDQVLAEI